MAGPDLAGHPGAAGEGNHPDAVQQVVEEHRGRVHQTGQTVYHFIPYGLESAKLMASCHLSFVLDSSCIALS